MCKWEQRWHNIQNIPSLLLSDVKCWQHIVLERKTLTTPPDSINIYFNTVEIIRSMKIRSFFILLLFLAHMEAVFNININNSIHKFNINTPKVSIWKVGQATKVSNLVIINTLCFTVEMNIWKINKKQGNQLDLLKLKIVCEK